MKMHFKPALTIALTAVLSFALAACSNDDDFAFSSDVGNPLLAYVPEDAPYLAGNLEPMPEEVITAMFVRFQPAINAIQAELENARNELAQQADSDDSSHALALAVLNELDGNLNPEGMKALGFSMKPQQAVYGMGMFPVVRITLSDAQALRDTIARIEANSGRTFPQEEFQGQSYWRLADDSAHSRGDFQGGVYLAIIEQDGNSHFAFSIFPTQAEADFLPAFLGKAMPAVDTASARLSGINQDYGYTPYGTGLMDFQRIFDQLADPDSLFNRSINQDGKNDLAGLDAVCRAEIESMIAVAPRMVVGTTEMTPSAIGAQYRLELENALASELAALVADVPPVPTRTERLLEFAFGIRIGAARDFMTRKLTELAQKPYQCEQLRDINSWAEDSLVKLNYPMPPLVNNLLGLRASLDQMPEDQGDLASARGSVAIHMDKPEMVLGMAQMFLPAMENVTIEKGGPPVELPQSVLPTNGVTAYAAMSDSALGIALGQDEAAGLTEYLAAESDGSGSFLSVNYDMAAYMDRMDDLTDDLMAAGAMGQDAEYRHENDVQRAFQEAFKNMSDRNVFELRFDEQGFAIDNLTTFKD